MNRLWIVIISLSVLFSCSSSNEQVDVATSKGIRVISLAPSITKELQYLGLSDQIVGATTYCNITKEKSDLIIGTATEVNIEKVLLLKPDIVFASGLTKASTIKTLESNNIAVHLVPKLKSFGDICSELEVIANKTNTSEKARLIITEAKHKIDSLKQYVKASEEPLKVFFQIGAKPLYTVIPNTFMDDYISLAACENIASDLTSGSISRESVLNRNPDVIFIVTMGIVGDEERLVWEKFPEINAVKHKKVFIIDSNLACTPSVVSFVESLELIIKNIYKDDN